MPPNKDDDTGALENARKRLYEQGVSTDTRSSLPTSGMRVLRHEWEENSLQGVSHRSKRHLRFAGIFFVVSLIFFAVSFGAAGYFFYFGGNSVSVDKIMIEVLGPTTIAGGDIVPFSFTISNKNPVSIENATIEINFPDGTRSADGALKEYPRYTENIGTLASGATITRSIKAIIFGGAGKVLILPISFSFGTTGSNSIFVKKSSYALAVSSVPLSVSVDTLTETVSGKPITFTLNVRSNAAVPLENVVLSGSFPFGFTVTDSSLPLRGSDFILGTVNPGDSKVVTLTGTLSGQNNEQRVFHFTVGTSKSASDQSLAVTYMTQDATVVIAAPFISTSLIINGDTRNDSVISPGGYQNVTVSYANTLPTTVTNATISVALSGSAIDYDSIQTTNGFYNSTDRTIIFSKDTDPSLANLAPGASGIGSFTFSILSSGSFGAAQSLTFTTFVSGTRIGQSNVPEQVIASTVKTAKIATAISLSSSSKYSSGQLSNSGPIPPVAEQSTTYTIQLNARNSLNSIADGSVSTVLPVYVSYTGITGGTGLFSYDSASRTVSWNIGDISQGANVQGSFQVSLTPSTSQRGSSPALTGAISFSGYDRFAGVQVRASADPSTTETVEDPGYIGANAIVQ
ncbi:MAG: hypothetical protein Q8L30_02500 [bacterium]|nr:hypothetical protein [bacterium]